MNRPPQGGPEQCTECTNEQQDQTGRREEAEGSHIYMDPTERPNKAADDLECVRMASPSCYRE